MSNCRTGCPSQDHTDWGECLRASNLQMSSGDASRPTSQKKWNSELTAYRNARKQGIQPAGTTMAQVEKAIKASDKAGKAYDANTGGFKE